MMKYMMLYYDALEEYGPLSDDQFGHLVRAALRFAKTGEEPKLRVPESILWPGLRMRILRDAEKYRTTCEKRTEAAHKRWNQQNNADGAMQKDANASNGMQYKSESKIKKESESNIKSEGKAQPRYSVPAQNYTQRDYSGETKAAMERMMQDTWGDEDG